MVATLGGQPQVVTFALDALRARGEVDLGEVYVVHLSPENERVRHALLLLGREFSEDRYQGGACRFRRVTRSSAAKSRCRRFARNTMQTRGVADGAQPDSGLEGTGAGAAHLCCGRAAHGGAADHFCRGAAL